MKPTPNFMSCLNRFTSDESLTFAEEMSAAVVLPEGTKLSQLVDEFRPLKGSAHLWLVVIHQDTGERIGLSDNIFPYETVTSSIVGFLKKLFRSSLDQSLIEDKIDKSHTLLTVISFHDGDTMTGFKVISTLLFQELPNLPGYYIPYLGTAGDKFKLRGNIGDNRPWRRRGLTSLILHLLQTVCQLRHKATSLFLECRETLVPTYTKFGFCRCYSVDKSWDVPENMALEPTSDLVRMWNGTRVVTKAAISGTASISNNRPFRSCCRDVAFGHVHAQCLFELDVFLFEYIDSFEHVGSSYVGRCTMCGDLSEEFSVECFSARFYDFAISHLSRCTALRRDAKRRNMVELFVQSTKNALSMSEVVSDARVSSRSEWLSHYCRAVSDSSCIPGCGVPYFSSNKRTHQLLLTLPQRYSIRLAGKTPDSQTGGMDPSTSIVTHLQFSPSGRFVGYNISGTAFVLENEYVNSEFHDWFIYYVTTLSPRKFGVPDGAPSEAKGSIVPRKSNQVISPLVSQQLHRETCVFSSALSAFKHFGDFRAVASLRDRLFQSTMKPDRMGFLLQTLADRKLNYQPVKFKKCKLDPLSNLSPFPTVIKLCGRDGSSFHVVTVVGRLIFDSNSAEPLPLCQAALDWCCSYDCGDRNQFAFVVKAYRFTHHKPKSYWLQSF